MNEEQDPLGGNALRNEPGQPTGQRRRLARAGTGKDEQRPAIMGDGSALLVVEAIQPVEHAFDVSRPSATIMDLRQRHADPPSP